MCTGGENSLIMIKLYIYVQIFYMVRLPSKKKKKKKKKKSRPIDPFFFLACYRKHSFFFFGLMWIILLFNTDQALRLQNVFHA